MKDNSSNINLLTFSLPSATTRTKSVETTRAMRSNNTDNRISTPSAGGTTKTSTNTSCSSRETDSPNTQRSISPSTVDDSLNHNACTINQPLIRKDQRHFRVSSYRHIGFGRVLTGTTTAISNRYTPRRRNSHHRDHNDNDLINNESSHSRVTTPTNCVDTVSDAAIAMTLRQTYTETHHLVQDHDMSYDNNNINSNHVDVLMHQHTWAVADINKMTSQKLVKQRPSLDDKTRQYKSATNVVGSLKKNLFQGLSVDNNEKTPKTSSKLRKNEFCVFEDDDGDEREEKLDISRTYSIDDEYVFGILDDETDSDNQRCDSSKTLLLDKSSKDVHAVPDLNHAGSTHQSSSLRHRLSTIFYRKPRKPFYPVDNQYPNHNVTPNAMTTNAITAGKSSVFVSSSAISSQQRTFVEPKVDGEVNIDKSEKIVDNDSMYLKSLDTQGGHVLSDNSTQQTGIEACLATRTIEAEKQRTLSAENLNYRNGENTPVILPTVTDAVIVHTKDDGDSCSVVAEIDSEAHQSRSRTSTDITVVPVLGCSLTSNPEIITSDTAPVEPSNSDIDHQLERKLDERTGLLTEVTITCSPESPTDSLNSRMDHNSKLLNIRKIESSKITVEDLDYSKTLGETTCDNVVTPVITVQSRNYETVLKSTSTNDEHQGVSSSSLRTFATDKDTSVAETLSTTQQGQSSCGSMVVSHVNHNNMSRCSMPIEAISSDLLVSVEPNHNLTSEDECMKKQSNLPFSAMTILKLEQEDTRSKHKKLRIFSDDCSVSTRSTVSNLFSRPRRKKKSTHIEETRKQSSLSDQLKEAHIGPKNTKQKKKKTRPEKKNANRDRKKDLDSIDCELDTDLEFLNHGNTSKHDLKKRSNVDGDIKKKMRPSGSKKSKASKKNTATSLPILGATPASYTTSSEPCSSYIMICEDKKKNTHGSLVTDTFVFSASTHQKSDDVSLSSLANQAVKTNRSLSVKAQHGRFVKGENSEDLTDVNEGRKKSSVLPVRTQRHLAAKRGILSTEDCSSVSVASCTDCSTSSRRSILRRYASAIGKSLHRFKQQSTVASRCSAPTKVMDVLDLSRENEGLLNDTIENTILFSVDSDSSIKNTSSRNLLSQQATTYSDLLADGGDQNESFDFSPVTESDNKGMRALGSFDSQSNDDGLDFLNKNSDPVNNITVTKSQEPQSLAFQNVISPADIEVFLNIPSRRMKRHHSCALDDNGSSGSNSTCSTLTNPTVVMEMDRYTVFERPKSKSRHQRQIDTKDEVVITLYKDNSGNEPGDNCNGSDQIEIAGGLQIRNGYLEYSLSDVRSVGSKSNGSTSSHSRRIQRILKDQSRDCLRVTNVETLNQFPLPAAPSRFTDDMLSYTIPQQIQSNYQAVSILLTQAQLKIFEIVSVMVNPDTQIGDVLSRARAAAIDDRLGAQVYISLCNDVNNVSNLAASISDLICFGNSMDSFRNKVGTSSSDRVPSQSRLTKNEVMKKQMEKLLLVAIPVGSTASDCQRIRRVLWRNPRLQRWWKSQHELYRSDLTT